MKTYELGDLFNPNDNRFNIMPSDARAKINAYRSTLKRIREDNFSQPSHKSRCINTLKYYHDNNRSILKELKYLASICIRSNRIIYKFVKY